MWYSGFQALCDSFALDEREFKEIFDMGGAVFRMLDRDQNGLIDMLQLFSVLALLADSRVEDKLRCTYGCRMTVVVLFELFDFNQSNFLDRNELEFLLWSAVEGLKTAFLVDEMLPPEFLESFVEQSAGGGPGAPTSDSLLMTASGLIK